MGSKQRRLTPDELHGAVGANALYHERCPDQTAALTGALVPPLTFMACAAFGLLVDMLAAWVIGLFVVPPFVGKYLMGALFGFDFYLSHTGIALYRFGTLWHIDWHEFNPNSLSLHRASDSPGANADLQLKLVAARTKLPGVGHGELSVTLRKDPDRAHEICARQFANLSEPSEHATAPPDYPVIFRSSGDWARGQTKAVLFGAAVVFIVAIQAKATWESLLAIIGLLGILVLLYRRYSVQAKGQELMQIDEHGLSAPALPSRHLTWSSIHEARIESRQSDDAPDTALVLKTKGAGEELRIDISELACDASELMALVRKHIETDQQV